MKKVKVAKAAQTIDGRTHVKDILTPEEQMLCVSSSYLGFPSKRYILRELDNNWTPAPNTEGGASVLDHCTLHAARACHLSFVAYFWTEIVDRPRSAQTSSIISRFKWAPEKMQIAALLVPYRRLRQ